MSAFDSFIFWFMKSVGDLLGTAAVFIGILLLALAYFYIADYWMRFKKWKRLRKTK